MKIKLTSVMVTDQARALQFYTEVLGFILKTDVPLREHRWLTVVAPDEPDGVELLLEPLGFEPARAYQQALFAAGIPLASFSVDDVQREYKRLRQRGVLFSLPPTVMGAVTLAVLDDTCGNHIQLVQA
jgi:catechol 2,3-dioxygenase-like lactoylglutathione lyase family enzyme